MININFNSCERTYLVVGLTRFYVLNDIDEKNIKSEEMIKMLKACNKGNIYFINKLIFNDDEFTEDEVGIIKEILDTIKLNIKGVYNSNIDNDIKKKIKNENIVYYEK